MISGKNKKINIYIGIACIMLLALSCHASDDITLPNPAKFEPLQIRTTAEINTETSRAAESRNIPAPEVPIPDIVNSFFAPIDENPKQLNRTETGQNYLLPQPDFNELTSAVEENPFKTLHSIRLPSEYRSDKTPPAQNVFTEINPEEQELPALDSLKEASYVSSVVEETGGGSDECEGKTISKVNFKGLSRISDDVLLNIIKTNAGAKFNFERIQNDLQNIYALGYFKDNMCVEPELDHNGDIILTYILEENIIVKETEISGNTVITSQELKPFTEKLVGLPQNLNLINESIEKINNYYEEKGYILAKVINVEDNADGKLIFVISEGIIEKINIAGNAKTKDYVIERNILTKPGSVYNEEIIKKDLAKIFDTQIFETVDREITPSEDKENEYIVTVKVKEGSSNSLTLGLGIDNALGGFGSVGYNEKNLFGKGQKLSLSGMLGSGLLLSDASIKNRMNWNLELNFFEPRFLSENNTFASKFYYRDLGSYEVPLAIERRFGVNNTIEHKVRGYDNLTTSLALGYEYINLKEGDLAKISSIYRQSHVDFSKRREQLRGGSFLNVAPGIKYSDLDDKNMPRDGLTAQVNYVEAFGLNDTKLTNGRFIGSITKYIPVFKKSTLLIGAKGGVKVHGKDMPEVMAFRLGGPYTIRGFKMNGVGSGESFAMASAELQTPIPFMDKIKYDFFKNLRFAFFADAGKIFDPTITSTLYDRPLSAITMGVGLRVNIPGMSTIAIDYGIPLTHTGKYSSQKGYFTFGTGGLYDSY